MAILVDARDEAAAIFHRRHNFLPLTDQPRRLFLPMATISKPFN